MKTLVVGSSGGSGRAAVAHLLKAGHEVTAFSRSGLPAAFPQDARLAVVRGDAALPGDVERAVRGHDAVVVTLGIRENPLSVRFGGARKTSTRIRSEGTRNVIAAMTAHGVKRIVVQTSYGVGETRHRLGTIDRLFFDLVLKPQIEDTERQEEVVRSSRLDWVLVQPVHLTDDTDDREPFVSIGGEVRRMRVSRGSVGRFLTRAIDGGEYVHRSVAVSGASDDDGALRA